MDIYDRINKLLEEKKMTRTQLSKKTGVSYNTLTSLFSRRSKNIDIETLKKIALGLETSVEYLVTGNHVPNIEVSAWGVISIPEKYKDVYVAFQDGDKEITQDDIDDVVRYIEFIKSKKK